MRSVHHRTTAGLWRKFVPIDRHRRLGKMNYQIWNLSRFVQRSDKSNRRIPIGTERSAQIDWRPKKRGTQGPKIKAQIAWSKNAIDSIGAKVPNIYMKFKMNKSYVRRKWETALYVICQSTIETALVCKLLREKYPVTSTKATDPLSKCTITYPPPFTGQSLRLLRVRIGRATNLFFPHSPNTSQSSTFSFMVIPKSKPPSTGPKPDFINIHSNLFNNCIPYSAIVINFAA